MWKKLLVITTVLMNAVIWQACEYEVVPAAVNCDESPVTVEIVNVTDSNCELSNGSIQVNASGGNGDYQFALGDGDMQASAVFSGLGAGIYEITAMDGNGCSATMEVAVLNAEGMNITFVTGNAGCGPSQGSLTVTAFDGAEPYQYRLGNGNFTSSNTFSGLSRGVYNLTVKDATGCQVMQEVRIRSGVSFNASISPIIEKDCAVNGCHNGPQFPDFRTFKNIHDNAAQIKTLTGNRTMPPGGNLTQAEINMIACWVDDGAPDN